MTVVLAATAGVFGSLIGSFLNVVIYRTPRGESVVSPPSSCPGCGTRIRAVDNVPVLSWLVLRGRCRDCGMRISARYPLVESATTVFFVVVALTLGAELLQSDGARDAGTAALTLAAFLYLAAITVALALIDLDTHRLPNVIVLPAYLVGVSLLGTASLLAGDGGALVRAVVGCVALGAAYLIMAMLYPGGMGFGDVKLAGVLGLFLAWLGWGELLVGAFAAFVLGGIFSIILVASRRADRRTAIPFGPWMLAGAWTGILFGEALWSTYLALVGLG